MSNPYFKTRHKQFSVGVKKFENDLDDPPIDPYFLGAWFGDGAHNLRGVRLSKVDREIRDLALATAAEWGLRVRIDSEFARFGSPTYNIVGERGKDNALLGALRRFVGPELYIPQWIRRGGWETRRQFLAGFLDTDGELGSNCFTISQKREDWARAAWFLARSIGLCGTIRPRQSRDQHGTEGTYHVVIVSGDVDMIPTRIPRKQAKPRRQRKDALRTGFAITPVGDGVFFGFALDGDGRFLLGDLTVTNNAALGRGS